MNVKNAIKAFVILAALATAWSQIQPVIQQMIDNMAASQPATQAAVYQPMALNRTAVGSSGYIFAFTQAVLTSSLDGISLAAMLLIAVLADVILLPAEITLELFAALQAPVEASDILTIAILAVLLNLAVAKSADRAIGKIA